MKLSFVILTWNSAQHIRRCLETLVENAASLRYPYEIFVVDNGSIDESVTVVNRFAEDHAVTIHLTELPKNRGTTFSRNLALRKVRGDYVGILDADVEILPGSLRGLIRVLDADERNGIAAPRLSYATGALQKSTDRFPTIFTKMQRYFFLKQMERRESAVLDTGPRFVDYAISAFWMIKREVLDVVGLLDERIFYAPEDVDYCLRLWKRGYRVLYVPDVSMIHHAQEISRGFRLNRATLSHVRGLFYYFRKHGYFWVAPSFSCEAERKP